MTHRAAALLVLLSLLSLHATIRAADWQPVEPAALPGPQARPTDDPDHWQIRRGHVLMRTLRPHPKTEDDPHDTLETAQAFKVDAIVWAYDTGPDWIAKASALGIGVGQAMSPNGWPDLQEVPNYVEKFAARNIEGEQVVYKHYHHFNNPFTRHMVADMNIPAYVDFYSDHVTRLYNNRVVSLHRDNPGGNYGIFRAGGTFTDDSVEYFRRYLKKHYTPEQLRDLGVENIDTFNVREHFKALGAPTGYDLWKWTGSPLLPIFKEAQLQATAEFFRTVRRRAEARSGRRIPWSCNGSGPWTDIDRIFDFRIGEFQFHFNQPQTMLALQQYARDEGKMQALISMVQRNYAEAPEFVPNTRLNIATAYALGMVPLVPWDVYMHDAPRYFGTVEDFGDLFHFVSKYRVYFDGYELESATGVDLRNNLYEWLPNRELVYPEGRAVAPLRINNENVFAFLRGAGSDTLKVVHLVDWNREPGAFDLSLDPVVTVGAPTARLVLLRPGKAPVAIEHYGGETLSVPPLAPWGMLVVEAAHASNGRAPAPRVLTPARSIVPRGTGVIFAEPEDGRLIEARFVHEGTSAKPVFRPIRGGAAELKIDADGWLEARVLGMRERDTSGFLRLRFHVYDDLSVAPDDVAGEPVAIEERFANQRGEMKINAPLIGEGLVLMGETVERGVAVQGQSLVACSTEPGWRYFTVDVGFDDEEERRPCARFQVLYDGRLVYETPILNPMKNMIQDSVRRSFPIALRVPEGTEQIRLRVVKSGFFADQNSAIWARPTAYE